MITCPRNLETACNEEISSLIEELGDSSYNIQHTIFSGILIASSNLGHSFVVSQIKKIILTDPWRVRFCLKIIPLHKVVETSEDNIVDSATQISHSIDHNKGETYRITVKKRGGMISNSSIDIIEKIAKNIPAKVCLTSYDWDLRIELIGGVTGISLIKDESSEVLSLEKIKRSLSE